MFEIKIMTSILTSSFRTVRTSYVITEFYLLKITFYLCPFFYYEIIKKNKTSVYLFLSILYMK
jgi:hypothetical protein